MTNSQCSIYKLLLRTLDEFADEGVDIAECEACRELNQIRATLIVNYGENQKHNKSGFTIKDEGTTLNMMIAVLERLTEKRHER